MAIKKCFHIIINVMEILTIIGIAISLSMDAFAVSIANGIILKKNILYHSFRTGIFFGSFQAIMPVIGWFLGISFYFYINTFAHLIGFGLLVFIGIKMIYEASHIKENERKYNCKNLFGLILLSFSTSIDAFIIGVSFAFLKIHILLPILIIGSITFFLSFLGIVIGNKIWHFFENKIEIFGGVILILIGIKILFS